MEKSSQLTTFKGEAYQSPTDVTYVRKKRNA